LYTGRIPSIYYNSMNIKTSICNSRPFPLSSIRSLIVFLHFLFEPDANSPRRLLGHRDKYKRAERSPAKITAGFLARHMANVTSVRVFIRSRRAVSRLLFAPVVVIVIIIIVTVEFALAES